MFFHKPGRDGREQEKREKPFTDPRGYAIIYFDWFPHPVQAPAENGGKPHEKHISARHRLLCPGGGAVRRPLLFRQHLRPELRRDPVPVRRGPHCAALSVPCHRLGPVCGLRSRQPSQPLRPAGSDLRFPGNPAGRAPHRPLQKQVDGPPAPGAVQRPDRRRAAGLVRGRIHRRLPGGVPLQRPLRGDLGAAGVLYPGPSPAGPVDTDRGFSEKRGKNEKSLDFSEIYSILI